MLPKQVLINLVQNACEAIAPKEVVTCSITKDKNPEFIKKAENTLPILWEGMKSLQN